jgi:hypothetical protein
VAADGTYTPTLPAPTADGPLLDGDVRARCGGEYQATDTRLLTVDRGTTVTITASRVAVSLLPTPRSTPRKLRMAS